MKKDNNGWETIKWKKWMKLVNLHFNPVSSIFWFSTIVILFHPWAVTIFDNDTQRARAQRTKEMPLRTIFRPSCRHSLVVATLGKLAEGSFQSSQEETTTGTTDSPSLSIKNISIAGVQNCPDIVILNSLFDLCRFVFLSHIIRNMRF